MIMIIKKIHIWEEPLPAMGWGPWELHSTTLWGGRGDLARLEPCELSDMHPKHHAFC